jgi:hypothetical protein
VSPPEDLDCLSHAELKGLVVKQWDQMVERMVAALRDEIARVKGGPGRPSLKPSGMHNGTISDRAGNNRQSGAGFERDGFWSSAPHGYEPPREAGMSLSARDKTPASRNNPTIAPTHD